MNFTTQLRELVHPNADYGRTDMLAWMILYWLGYRYCRGCSMPTRGRWHGHPVCSAGCAGG